MKPIACSLIALLLCSLVTGCKPVINSFAFIPDSDNTIPTDRLPSEIEEITVETADSEKITSLYLPAPSSSRLLIYFHGNAGNIYHRIPSLLKLHDAGVNVIGVSYRGYGKSSGAPSEAGINLDGAAVLEHAVEQLGFSEENIILFGRSIGSTVAVKMAQHKKLRGVILATPLTNGKAVAKANGMGWFSYLAGESFNNLVKIGNISSPLLVIHGTADRIVPYSMGEAIYKRAKTEKRFVTIEGAGHNNLQSDYEQEYWAPIISFIKGL